jgi:hypothetical protein
LFWIASFENSDFFTGRFVWRLVVAKESPQCPETKTARKRQAFSIHSQWHHQGR